MKKMKDIEKNVKKILENFEDAREDDMYLYYLYFVIYTNFEENLDYAFKFAFISKNFRIKHRIPCYSSIERARRKIQQNNVELRASEKVQKIREDRKDEIIEYALEDTYSKSFSKFIDSQE